MECFSILNLACDGNIIMVRVQGPELKSQKQKLFDNNAKI